MATLLGMRMLTRVTTHNLAAFALASAAALAIPLVAPQASDAATVYYGRAPSRLGGHVSLRIATYSPIEYRAIISVSAETNHRLVGRGVRLWCGFGHDERRVRDDGSVAIVLWEIPVERHGRYFVSVPLGGKPFIDRCRLTRSGRKRSRRKRSVRPFASVEPMRPGPAAPHHPQQGLP